MNELDLLSASTEWFAGHDAGAVQRGCHAFEAITGRPMAVEDALLLRSLTLIAHAGESHAVPARWTAALANVAMLGAASLSTPPPTNPIPPSIKHARARAEQHHEADCTRCGGTGIEPGYGGQAILFCPACTAQTEAAA